MAFLRRQRNKYSKRLVGVIIMIVIREIRQEDFECLLNNESLRSLITIDTGGANVFL